MTQQHPHEPSPVGDPTPDDTRPRGGDPWHAFGYLVAGVFMYGGLGWVADRWLGTSFLVVIGILLGAGLGIYMTIARFDALPRRQDDKKQR